MNKELQSYWLRHGLYAGLIQGILYLILYFIDRSLLVSYVFGFLILIFVIAYPMVATVKFRKAHNNILIFKDSFASIFFISALRGVIAGFFFLALFILIDPQLGTYLHDNLINKTVSTMQMFNASEEEISKAVARIEADGDQYAIGRQVRNIFFTIPFAAFLSLIGAAIVKRNPPPFSDNTLDTPAN